ncbi:MAG: CPBP family intramembrane glutamic endopeptidase [Pseudomonadota bacterium]
MSTRYSIGAALAYVRRPYFPAGRDRIGEDALRHLMQLLALSLAFVVVSSSVLGGIIAAVTGGVPENMNATLGEAEPVMLVLAAVLFAPVIEEVLFRSWLGGARLCLLGLPVLLSLLAVGTAAGQVGPMLSFGLAGALSVLILSIARRYSELSPEAQRAARWRLFPTAFYGSALLFAMLHLSNYEGGFSSPVMALAVLPQFVVGLVLGYVRMRFGLVAAIIFHALYNFVLVGLFLVSQSIAPVADSAALVGGHMPA